MQLPDEIQIPQQNLLDPYFIGYTLVTTLFCPWLAAGVDLKRCMKFYKDKFPTRFQDIQDPQQFLIRLLEELMLDPLSNPYISADEIIKAYYFTKNYIKEFDIQNE